MYDDYPTKFGRIKGTVLAKMQISAMKKSDKTIACSESLTKIYKEKLHQTYDFIRNGVDIEQYTMPDVNEKLAIRKKLGLPEDAFVWVYTGQFIERKNIPFLLKNYVEKFGDDVNSYILLLGEGPELKDLSEKYASNLRVDFRGSISNVNYYLKACDAYVSTSRSEGLPNGVLEAMATGLPVVLSDIEQHKEIFEANDKIGFLYRQNDGEDFERKLEKLYHSNVKEAGHEAYMSAHENFSSVKMSKKYQTIYKEIVG